MSGMPVSSAGHGIPATPADLTPEWLTEALCAQPEMSGVRVRAVEVQPLARGMGLLCQIARLTPTYEAGAAAGPRTLVAKMATDEPETRGVVAIFRFYEREVRFYEELAAAVPVRTPRCYASAFSPDRGDFVLLMEDLGALRTADQLDAGSAADARVVAEALVGLHARFWGDASLEALAWLIAVDDEINRMGMGLYQHAWPSFCDRLGGAVPPDVLRVGERLGEHLVGLLDAMAQSPRTLCHGDVRLDNLFFGREPGAPPTFADWQISVRGTGTGDLAYFMSQSLDADVRRSAERDILARYHAGLVAAGIRGYDFAQCVLDYRRAVLFCFVYPVIGGGLGDSSNARGQALARAMSERSAAAILDWDATELLRT